LPPPSPSTLFPYTTLFRSLHFRVDRLGAERAGRGDQLVGRAGGQRDEPAAEVRELHERHLALALLAAVVAQGEQAAEVLVALAVDRKSTRLNSSHQIISYA